MEGVLTAAVGAGRAGARWARWLRPGQWGRDGREAATLGRERAAELPYCHHCRGIQSFLIHLQTNYIQFVYMTIVEHIVHYKNLYLAIIQS